MSIRLHELAKKIGMDNKELLALLKGRDYPVKTVSSTVDKITAEALEEEFGRKTPPPPAAPAAAPAPAEPKAGTAVGELPAEKAPAFTTHLPTGVFVKSAQDIAREKEELAKASRPQVVFPAPRPAAPPVMRVTPTVTSRPPLAPRPVSSPPAARPAPPAPRTPAGSRAAARPRRRAPRSCAASSPASPVRPYAPGGGRDSRGYGPASWRSAPSQSSTW